MRHSAKNDDLSPAGYSGYIVKDEESFGNISLLLPRAVLQALQDDQIAAAAAQRAQEDQDIARAKKADDERLFGLLKPRSSAGLGDLELSRETKDLEEAASAACQPPEAQQVVAVYDVLEPLTLIKDLKVRTPDREIHKRNESLYKQIKRRGHLRTLAQPQGDLQDLEQMRRAFPHFSPVLDLVRDQFAFSVMTGKPFVIPPILLGGDPGIGKTRFSQELAKTLGTVMHRMPFDSGQTGSVLLGSAKNWANTTYGSVFELIVLGEFANPVILLDEIDKASKHREGDALASLHSLLEPVTSQRVRDISVDFVFNASRITWIATANKLDRIPQSLRSRFQEFWIEQPTGEQALQMAEIVAMEVHEEMSLPGFAPPNRQVVHFLAHLSAREQVQALKRAYAAATSAGRSRLTLPDLPEQVRQEAAEIADGETPPTGWVH